MYWGWLTGSRSHLNTDEESQNHSHWCSKLAYQAHHQQKPFSWIRLPKWAPSRFTSQMIPAKFISCQQQFKNYSYNVHFRKVSLILCFLKVLFEYWNRITRKLKSLLKVCSMFDHAGVEKTFWTRIRIKILHMYHVHKPLSLMIKHISVLHLFVTLLILIGDTNSRG